MKKWPLMNENTLWRLSLSFALFFAALTAYMWYRVDAGFAPNPEQLVSDADVQNYLKTWQTERQSGAEGLQLIPTGLFIQSFKFRNSSEVNLTGYLWQRYKKGLHDDIERGFVFPEAVDSGSDIEPRLEYRHDDGDEEVLGWYFEVTLRQKFDYRHYPLDHKTVWIRLWPKSFERQAVLVPNLASYRSTLPGETFGIDDNIVLGGWEITETYFDYRSNGYDTNFGLASLDRDRPMPELYFNIALERRFINGFVISLIPLLTVAALLFASMIIVTGNSERASVLGFSTSGVTGVASALFFVVLLAHVQLREQFAGSGIVYLEYFYLLMYLVIVGVVVNTYLFTSGLSMFTAPLRYRDNLIAKIMFWPLLSGSMALVTYVALLA